MKVGPFPNGQFPSHFNRTGSFSLRAGQTVRLLVEGRRGDALLVRIGTRVLTARVQGDVRPGGVYRAEVVSTGRTLVLRTLERPAERLDAGALARSHGLPSGPESEAVIRSFVRSGLPLQAERLALALRRVRSSPRLTVAERARLAAVLEDKGLLDANAAWDRAVVGAGGGSSHDERGGTDERGRDAGEHNEPDRRGSDDRHDSDSSDPAPDAPGNSPQEPAIGAADVEAAFRAGPEADDLLQLVNHRAGRDDTWVMVPLEFGPGVDLSASVRMRLRHPTGAAATGGSGATGAAASGAQPYFLEAVLDVRSAGGRWTFAIHPTGGSLRVNVLAEPTAPDGTYDAPPWSELARRLARLGIDFDHGLMSKDSNDGFSTEESAAIIESIDSRA
ncbi:MAG: hypothetical protein ACOCZB_05665 [Spirochaetota bacterium]